MTTLAIDYESYYDTSKLERYSLKHMPTVLYIRDPRFKLFGASVSLNFQEPKWIPSWNLPTYLNNLPWDEITLIGHNLLFDGLITHDHFSHSPKQYLDTLSMSKAIFPHLTNHKLNTVAKHCNLGHKIPNVLENLNGVKNPTHEQLTLLAQYANQDLQLELDIYHLLYPIFQKLPNELAHMHLTSRMGCEPKLEIDSSRAHCALNREKVTQQNILHASPIPKSVLSSNQQFVQYLKSQDITVPEKENAKGDIIPALGQNDYPFKQLQAQHPELKTVWDARRVAKSTIGITRMQKLIDIGKSGTLPVPYTYYAAHTGRTGGTDGYNMANLPRGSEIRKSIIAPPGYLIMPADSSQIELRFTYTFCGQLDMVEVLRNGQCVYCVSAKESYGYEVIKGMPERNFGKAKELGLTYGMGHNNFQIQCAIGLMGCDPIQLTDSEAFSTVDNWRRSRYMVKHMWDKFKNAIPQMALDPECSIEIAPIRLIHQAIELPNGMIINYEGLHKNPEDDNWYYGKGKKIYGAKILENVIQSLARIAFVKQLLECDAHPLLHAVGQTYDEGIFLIPEQHADEAKDAALEIMSQSPTWMPQIPLKAEAEYAKEYSK